jgi:EAL and modified HD-GYP domain-containing signal transduction protein
MWYSDAAHRDFMWKDKDSESRMEVFVARQPIFDTQLKTFGYELLFRESLDNYFPEIDGDTASSAVLTNSFFSIGIEKLTGGKKAFINFTRDLLLRQVPSLFSPKILYSELLETLEPDKILIDAVTQMTRSGCRFALDDFVFHEKYEPLMRFAAVIKIDIRQTPLEETKPLIDRFAGRSTRFLAEKVETREEYDKAVAMGYSYFQGYFFSKPEIVQKRSIAPFKIRLLEILGELNREDTNVDQLETLIKPDVSLSYRLLQYMNSAFFNLPNKVTSIKGAILFLGLSQVRKIVTLLVTAKLADSKPNELIRVSIIRAKLCELAGEARGFGGDTSELFLLGLFSLMDAILDADMAEIVNDLPVSDRLKLALTKKEGELAEYLKAVSCFEKGEWDDASEMGSICDSLDLTIEKYVEAVEWADAYTRIV